ncbi:hypothetical protein, partial [Arsenicibacter rosenii]|uniref:hypothetical protein n=1 Tax=Arsenicibacter rosenii TaxID=1750698 RepID=UPI0015A5592C
LHFRTILLGQRESELNRVTGEKDKFAGLLISCRTEAAGLATSLLETKAELGRQRRKRRWNQVQKWALIGLSSWLGYRQLRPFLPP